MLEKSRFLVFGFLISLNSYFCQSFKWSDNVFVCHITLISVRNVYVFMLFCSC